MDYRVQGAMLEAYCKLETKPKTIAKSRKRFRLSGATCQRDQTVKDLSN